MRSQLLSAVMCVVAVSVGNADESLNKLISQLGDPKNSVSDEIARRGDRAVEPLARLLRDGGKPQLARMNAASLLGKIGGKKALAHLRAAVADEKVQHFVVWALEAMGPSARESVPDLAKLLRKRAKDRNVLSIRSELIRALEKIGGSSQEAVDALVLCMKVQRCSEAAYALTRFGEPGAEALITLSAAYSKDERPQNERRYGEAYLVTAWGMPRLPKEMIPVFEKHFATGDPATRRVATLALAGVGEPAIPVLAKYLEHKNSDLRAAAADGLVTMNWFADRSKERGEKVSRPVSANDFYPKFKSLYKTADGKVDYRIVREMLALDHDRAMADPEIFNVVVEGFKQALEKELAEKKTPDSKSKSKSKKKTMPKGNQ